jgi:hypothetical protein
MVTIVPARKCPGQDEPITKVLSSQSEERQRDSEREREKNAGNDRESERVREKNAVFRISGRLVWWLPTRVPSSVLFVGLRVQGSGFKV